MRAKAAATEAHRFAGRALFGVGAAVCALGFQSMQSSDLAGSVPPYVSTANFTQDQLDGMGYYPQSTLSNLACAAVLLIAAYAVAVYANLAHRQ
jgi:hypothetical protein